MYPSIGPPSRRRYVIGDEDFADLEQARARAAPATAPSEACRYASRSSVAPPVVAVNDHDRSPMPSPLGDHELARELLVATHEVASLLRLVLTALRTEHVASRSDEDVLRVPAGG